MLSIGIVGLPNAGKSTLFNALTKSAGAEVADYPFTTIEPNVGVVEVPDKRLVELKEKLKVPNAYPSITKFVDIAGLVKGAHRGEGLGNQFLSHIREVDAVMVVLKFFEKRNEPETGPGIVEDPVLDLETIKDELVLKDLEIVEKRLEKVGAEAKSGEKEALIEKEFLKRLKTHLEQGKKVLGLVTSEEESEILKELNILTAKPQILALNFDEPQKNFVDEQRQSLSEETKIPEEYIIPINAKFEAELAELSEAEQKELLRDSYIEERAIDELIQAAYKILSLITFFTFNEKEVRAWPIREGSTVFDAAGLIHTDFQKGFIRAEVSGWKNILESGGWAKAREKGVLNTVSRDHPVQDGDVILIKFKS